MFETKCDRAAIVLGVLAAISVFFLIAAEVVGNVSGGDDAIFLIVFFSLLNGFGTWWGVRYLQFGWTPPVVYALISSIVSMSYINIEGYISWSRDEGFVPIIVYVVSFFGSMLLLFIAASVISWICDGQNKKSSPHPMDITRNRRPY